MTRSSYALAAAMTLGGASGGVVMAQICGIFMSASWVVGAVVGGACGIVTFAQLRLEDYLAEKRREWSDEAPRVEGDLDLDDGRPTDPGEELTVVSEPAEVPVADCEHQSPDLCVSWDYPMITVDGAEYQIAGWCRECGALRVFASDDLDEERWLLPRKGASRG